MSITAAGRVTTLVLVAAITVTTVLTGTAILAGTATAQCEPTNGAVSGCQGDTSTIEEIGGNFVDALESLLFYAGLVAFLLGVVTWSPATPSSSLMVSARSWIFGGLAGVAISFALPTIIGVIQWLVQNGV